jgi:hypothetical protein
MFEVNGEYRRMYNEGALWSEVLIKYYVGDKIKKNEMGEHVASLTKRNGKVAQLVEAMRYKPEGRGFDSRWCHWNFCLK